MERFLRILRFETVRLSIRNLFDHLLPIPPPFPQKKMANGKKLTFFSNRILDPVFIQQILKLYNDKYLINTAAENNSTSCNRINKSRKESMHHNKCTDLTLPTRRHNCRQPPAGGTAGSGTSPRSGRACPGWWPPCCQSISNHCTNHTQIQGETS